jgi:hypothetical protein
MNSLGGSGKVDGIDDHGNYGARESCCFVLILQPSIPAARILRADVMLVFSIIYIMRITDAEREGLSNA